LPPERRGVYEKQGKDILFTVEAVERIAELVDEKRLPHLRKIVITSMARAISSQRKETEDSIIINQAYVENFLERHKQLYTGTTQEVAEVAGEAKKKENNNMDENSDKPDLPGLPEDQGPPEDQERELPDVSNESPDVGGVQPADQRERTTRGLNVVFSETAYKTVHELAQRNDKSVSELVRDAIALQKWFDDIRGEGWRILIEKRARVREIVKTR
jgi:hypothetical protein